MAGSQSDGMFTSALANALADEPLPRSMWALYLLAVAMLAGIVWAAVAKIDQISRVQGRVVPEAREQVIASLDSGLLAELKVREGEEVQAGQELARLDPTRAEAQENEGALRRTAIRVAVARLRAEAYGARFTVPADVPAQSEAVALERQAYEARARLLDEAVASLDRSIGLLAKELKVAQDLSARGLMSEVEVMRVNRQINDLRQQRQERVSRFRQEASQELARQENELAALGEQQVVRQDAMKRTVLRSPVHGIVKNIRITTLGGVVTSGSPIMEIVPLGPTVLIEARVPPSEVGFIQVGQRAIMKIAGYDYHINGGLEGKIELISADTLGDNEKLGGAGDARYYRALVRADENTLKRDGKPLPVIPGMSAAVEIKTGERTVLSYLLRPLLKSQEALKER